MSEGRPTEAPPARLTAGPTFSVLIAGGTVVDGTGGPTYRADVGLRGDTIAAIGDLGAAGTTIDAAGLTVTPGPSASTGSGSPTDRRA